MKKRALVTGATSGIGFETAAQLVNNGWQVIGLGKTANEQSVPSGVIPYQANLLDEGIEKKISKTVIDQLGGLDLLVNNAGVSWVGPFAEMATNDIDRVFGVNVRSVMLMCREMTPLLTKSPNAQIVTVASVAAHLPMETLAAYCASKAAVVMFSQALARELAKDQIRVNVISPCGTDTNIFETVGVDIDKSTLMPADEIASLIILLTQLPVHVDISEFKINKRFSILF
jgi:NAD(P)-dependent dehydrogenase (short-subunit alcohol dehydrogenase family)